MAFVDDRARLLDDGAVGGRALARALSDAADAWLAELFAEATAAAADRRDPAAVSDGAGAGSGSMALVAVGGYGRAQLCPYSDLDVVLVHDDGVDAGRIADAIWYPVWDAGLRLGHAVRTVADTIAFAANDLETASGLLELRHVAGERRIVDELASAVEVMWDRSAERLLGELAEGSERRHERHGEVAFLLEPDLKLGRGGLRDVQAVSWADRCWQLCSDSERDTLDECEGALLGARVALHALVGRADDRLLLERQDAVAAALGLDADALMADVAGAARSIAWIGDDVMRRVRRCVDGPRRIQGDRDRPLAPGVIRRDGAVHVVADPSTDPAVALRAAAAAARSDSPIARESLALLADQLGEYGDPWPGDARDRLIDLLGQGRPAISVMEALDHVGVLTRILPEWAPVRSRPQRNAYHRYTVDRHLLEAAAEASRLTERVRRADLLLVASWLHDLGKGSPGDHTEAGERLVRDIGRRMGFPAADVETLARLVEHHLLLAEVATRRDLSDEVTLDRVADAVGDTGTLELLSALTEADGLATGPSAWGEWKASLVHTLSERVMVRLGGGHLELGGFLTEEHRRLLAERGVTIRGRGDLLTVVNTDRPGGFSRIAGALALKGLDVLEANAHSEDGIAVSVFKVVRSTGEPPVWDGVVEAVEQALTGHTALEARVAERERLYAPRKPVSATPARTSIEVTNAESATSTIVEVRTGDRIGVLFGITRALAELDLDVRHAKIQTLGHEVVDVFYVADRAGDKIGDEHADEVVLAIRHALRQGAG